MSQAEDLAVGQDLGGIAEADVTAILNGPGIHFLEHFRDNLIVAVDENDVFPPSLCKPGIARDAGAGVFFQRHQADAFPARGLHHLADHIDTVVRTAVVHHDDFNFLHRLGQDGFDAGTYVFLRIVQRNHG